VLRQTVLTPRPRQITSHGHQVGPLGCRHPADIVARYMFIVVRVAWPRTSSYHYSCSLGLCSCTRLSMTIIPGQGLMTLPGDGSTHCSLCHPHSPRRHQQSATRDQPDFLLENGPQIGSGRAPGWNPQGSRGHPTYQSKGDWATPHHYRTQPPIHVGCSKPKLSWTLDSTTSWDDILAPTFPLQNEHLTLL
jgi:hypothetical protein